MHKEPELRFTSDAYFQPLALSFRAGKSCARDIHIRDLKLFNYKKFATVFNYCINRCTSNILLY